MSELAVTEIGGEENTAWSYRTEFLTYGKIYPHFFCPFCNISLSPCNIYKEEKIIRSPYFKYYEQNHLNGCDGTPIFTDNRSNQQPKSKIRPMTRGSYPEALVPRQPPKRINPTIQSTSQIMIPAPEEIQRRRKNIGSRGRSIPSSSLLKSFVDEWKSKIHDSYVKFPEKKDELQRRTWINKVLSNMPLRLDDQTNYQSAFMRPQYIEFNKKRIYSSKGRISLEQSGFIIQGTEYLKSEQKNIDVRLTICIDEITDDSPQAHKKMLELLHQFASITADIEWYAYGRAELDGNRNFSLNIENFDHLYFKKQYIRN